ncbi:uncharacterized protein LOC114272687 [Camellia sinensis]|uniref:uncharacterized protein LOC114272687 n=1 Tax=Camellia sinensis TaxID=4442 RepID=UPI001035E303|nr:uncharacterized protein LOC114272687 [Camellia sinensis]
MISCFSSVIVPVFQSAAQALEGNSSSSTSLKAALDGGFGLQWSANSDLCSQCVTSGGQCGYESGSSSFTCFCSDKAYASSCSATQNGSTKGLQIWLKIGIGTNRMCSFLLELAIFIETAMFLSFQTTPNPFGGLPERREEPTTIKQFQDLKPIIFTGSTNPLVAEAWVRDIEKTFRVLPCTERQKETFATFTFKDDAQEWWLLTLEK